MNQTVAQKEAHGVAKHPAFKSLYSGDRGITPDEKHVYYANKSAFAGSTKKQSDINRVKFLSTFEPNPANSIVSSVPQTVHAPTIESEVARKSLAFKVLLE